MSVLRDAILAQKHQQSVSSSDRIDEELRKNRERLTIPQKRIRELGGGPTISDDDDQADKGAIQKVSDGSDGFSHHRES